MNKKLLNIILLMILLVSLAASVDAARFSFGGLRSGFRGGWENYESKRS